MSCTAVSSRSLLIWPSSLPPAVAFSKGQDLSGFKNAFMLFPTDDAVAPYKSRLNPTFNLTFVYNVAPLLSFVSVSPVVKSIATLTRYGAEWDEGWNDMT